MQNIWWNDLLLQLAIFTVTMPHPRYLSLTERLGEAGRAARSFHLSHIRIPALPSCLPGIWQPALVSEWPAAGWFWYEIWAWRMQLQWHCCGNEKKNKKADRSDGLQEDGLCENQLQGVQTILSCQQCGACVIYVSKNFIDRLHFRQDSALPCSIFKAFTLVLVGSKTRQKLISTGH